MENKRVFVFALRIAAAIIGITLYRQFDFHNLRFENTALGIIYLATFVFLVYVIVKDIIKK